MTCQHELSHKFHEKLLTKAKLLLLYYENVIGARFCIHRLLLLLLPIAIMNNMGVPQIKRGGPQNQTTKDFAYTYYYFTTKVMNYEIQCQNFSILYKSGNNNV